MTRDFRVLSRQGWNVPDGKPVAIEDLRVGALLRIADALESLVAHFRPTVQRVSTMTAEEDAKYQSERVNRQEWEWETGRSTRIVKKKMRKFFAGSTPDRFEWEAINKAVYGMHRWLDGYDLVDWEERNKRKPTKEEIATLHQRREQFDPAAFDFSTLDVTDLTRKRTTAMLARLGEKDRGGDVNGFESYWLCLKGGFRFVGRATCLMTNRDMLIYSAANGEMVICTPAHASLLGLPIDPEPVPPIPVEVVPVGPAVRDWSKHKAWCDKTAAEKGEPYLLLPHSENASDRPSDRGTLPYLIAESYADSWQRANAIHRSEVKT